MSSTVPTPVSRKRPAPGANPLPAAPQQHLPQQPYATHAQTMRWNRDAANGNNYADVSNQYATQHQPPYVQQQAQQVYQNQPQPQAQTQSQSQLFQQQSLSQQSQHMQRQASMQQPQPQAQGPSNAVARRDNGSRALVQTASHASYDPAPDQYETAIVPVNTGRAQESDPAQELRDAVAKAHKIRDEANKDNGQKRTIPPFVKKLATFLNNGHNSDLIRWSENGDSFLVLDEEEFAKKLIPEMFKHNNYASFVRQLNMYGFHKRVGLSDNSMRASEKKNKSPSEYSHPYFRRGLDVLQWLIQKPNKGTKRKQGGRRDVPEVIEADSDDELVDDQYAVSGPPGRPSGRAEAGPLARTDLGRLQQQVAELQQNHQKVLSMIHAMRAEQQDIKANTSQLEAAYVRHDHSISAMMQFLASLFKKSLEGGKTTAEHLTEVLANFTRMPGQGGSVQDLDMTNFTDLLQQQQQTNGGARNSASPVPQRRPQHLLPGIPVKHAASSASGRMASESPAPPDYAVGSGYQVPESSRVTEVYDTSPADSTTPNFQRNEHVRSQLQDDPKNAVMRIMEATNAAVANTPSPAPVNTPMNGEQPKSNMDSALSQHRATPSDHLPTSAFPAPAMPNNVQQHVQHSSVNSMPSTTSTVMSPTSGLMAAHTNAYEPAASQPSNALSPILSSSSPRAGLTTRVANSDHQLHEIENSLGEVGNGINQLAHTLGQLSPGGHIPGLDFTTPDGGEYFPTVDGPGSFDFDSFIDPNGGLQPSFDEPTDGQVDLSTFGNEHAFGGNEGAFGNYDFDPNNLPFSGPVDDAFSVSPPTAAAVPASKDTPSPADTEEIMRTDINGIELPAAKRHRQV